MRNIIFVINSKELLNEISATERQNTISNIWKVHILSMYLRSILQIDGRLSVDG